MMDNGRMAGRLCGMAVFALLATSQVFAGQEDAPEGAAPQESAAKSAAGPEGLFKEGEKAYVRGDMFTAVNLLTQAGNQGFAPAWALLGDIAYHSDYMDDALGHYRKAAELENPDGELGLGMMYANGLAVEKNDQEALKWFVKAAEKGNVRSINALADAYLQQTLGLEEKNRDNEKAVHWLKLAAENKHRPAVEGLLSAYTRGGFGLEPDPAQVKVYEDKLKEIDKMFGKKKRKRTY